MGLTLSPHVTPRPVVVVRWLARLASLVSITLIALMATDQPAWPAAREWLLLACFPGGVVAGMLVAWRREIIGGLLALSSLIVFHAFLALEGRFLSAGPWFLIFTSPALVLLVCGIIETRVSRRLIP